MSPRGVPLSRELGLRLALGASRRRIVRQLLTEAVLLAALGSVAAVLIAAWALEFLRVLEPSVLSTLRTATVPHLSLTVLAFNFGVATATALAFGIAPLAATRHDPRQLLCSAMPARRRSGPRGTLVVAEVAVAMVLLVAAGLVLRSLDRLHDTPLASRRSASASSKAER